MELLLWLCPLLHFHLLLSSSNAYHLCPDDESIALLQFKQMFTITNENMFGCEEIYHPKTVFWNQSTDCCTWDRVTCNRFTGRVVGLDLRCSQLSGTIQPNSSLLHLSHLQKLNLASNDLSGPYIFREIASLTSLMDVNLSYSFYSFYGESLRPEISLLSNLTKLRVLSLASIDLSSEVPMSLLNLSTSLVHLDLSSTGLSGELPDQLPWKSLAYLDLKSNLLQGELPSHICNLDMLQVLDLSGNNLTGTIPLCFGNFSTQLMVLDLRRNHFHGTIPTTFAENNRLKNIALNGNQLEGSLPRSLANCQQLEVLDLGNNNLTDEFPSWLENLRELRVLILKSNQFQGPISKFKTELPFPGVRIFDISCNEFTGQFPEKLFRSFKAMMSQDKQEGELQYIEIEDDNDIYYRDSMNLVIKGTEIEIARVLFTLTTIDFSSNKFEGEIPKLIGNLNSLKLLNLSHNKLQGHIPSSLGDLRKLKWLDLSSNQLEGEIPWQLTKLTSLAVLNLSENHLTGHIPRGNQFDTFENSSYTGNLALCGFPLAMTCRETETSQPSLPPITEQEDVERFMSRFSWKPVVMGYGCGVVFGLAIGCSMFLTGKPKWLIDIVENTFNLRKRPRKKYVRLTLKRT